MSETLQRLLKEVGSKLGSPPSNKEALVKLLKQAATCLSELEQSPSASVLESMQPFLDAVVKPELLKHQDRDVKLLVATCICEITRITAPEAPYSDDVLKDIFHLIVGTFGGLKDTSGPSFGRRVVILETVAKYRSCVVMLDLECDDLVKEMFRTFFAVASDDHAESVLTSMQKIMVALLEESEEIAEDLLFVLLSILGRNRSDITAAARRLAMNVIQQCADKLESDIKQFLISSISGDNRSSNSEIDYHEVIYDIYRCAPQILSGVVPYLTGELLTDQLETRLRVVKLVGDLFSLPGSTTSEAFQPIFSEFLKRLADRVVEVRMSVLEHVKSCLLSNPFRAEAPQVIDALCDRLLDYDENVRKQVVAVICDVACSALSSIPVETIKLVAERLRDKSLLVKKFTMEMLAEIYKLHCLKCSDGSMKPGDFDWIPGKILRCFYDKDFRSDIIEHVLSGSLFPTEFPVKAIVGQWVRVFSRFDRVEVKALEKILELKQRLQHEMLRYLSLRKISQDGNAPEIPKKIMFCFRVMARTFSDPAKAEENFQILDQLKDANIWRILTNLLNPNTSFWQSHSYRDGLLKILGEKHRLYDFLSILSVKTSYLLFNKEHVKELLLEVDVHKSAGDAQYIMSCMNILVVLASFSSLLLSGVEEELVNFLKDDNEIIKEGILQVLAKAGGTIREQLAVLSSSIDLILETLCLEGSRKQAKYAVHALAAITKDDGLKSLSVLYKKLVDTLEEKTHLPAVLQSLGCIAQIAVAVYETRESEIEDFIKSKILNCSVKLEGNKKASWEDRSEICTLKIYGIKTLVKSYLPVKDAHLRPRIDSLLEILRNMLSFGEYSKDVESSSVDKAHLRLASAKGVLRLERQWNHKIPIDMFHLTIRTSEISFPQARKLFLTKVHQYIKDRLLDARYAAAFVLNISGLSPTEFEEEKHNLADIIQICLQSRARQFSVHIDANTPMAYPEYILPFLVHAIAHHSCPNVDECKDVKKFELIYRQLYLFISMLLQCDDDGKFEADTVKGKRCICAIVSILKSIQFSEDVLDAEKSKNSYAICDLGLSIIKRLAQKEDNLQEMNTLISLPAVLYKSLRSKEGNDSKATEEMIAIEGKTAGEGKMAIEGQIPNEVQAASEGQTIIEGQSISDRQSVDEGKLASDAHTWLADESVLTHFESLKFCSNGLVQSEAANADILEDSDNEIPLRKILKHLKSRGLKARMGLKGKSLPGKSKNADNDVGILKTVREISFDDCEKSSKSEQINGHEHSPNEKSKKNKKHKKRKGSDVANAPVPKQQRLLSAVRLPKNTSKSPSTATKDDLQQTEASSFQSQEHDISAEDDIFGSMNSDLVLSVPKSISSKRKDKQNEKHHSGKSQTIEDAGDHDSKKSNVLMESDKINTNSSSRSPLGSGKKRRRSIVGLVKCSFKDGEDLSDLIGCRIKIWWPMDKKFYEGTVKSYDPIKRKHVVLYKDGDVEVLRLDKERWELINSSRKSGKKFKLSEDPSPTKASPGAAQKSKISHSLQQNKGSSKQVKGERTPKKNLKRRHKEVPESKLPETDSKENSDVSNPEPTWMSKVDSMNSGDFEGDHTEIVDENVTDGEQSDEEVKSVSKGKQSEDLGSKWNHAEESNEEKSDSEEKDIDKIRSVSENCEEEKADESSEEENPDCEENQENHAQDAESSDDEPLSVWKNRVGKSSSKC